MQAYINMYVSYFIGFYMKKETKPKHAYIIIYVETHTTIYANIFHCKIQICI